MIGIFLSKSLHQRFDKKPTLITACLVSAIAGQLAVVLKLLELLPDELGATLFALVAVFLVGYGMAAGLGYTSAGSMMADVAHDQFLSTGRNQQGILFSAVAFSGKLGSAGGHLIAGVGIDWIQFPLQEDPALVAPYMTVRLGLLSLIAAPIAFGGIWAYTHYQISQASYAAALGKVSSSSTT